MRVLFDIFLSVEFLHFDEKSVQISKFCIVFHALNRFSIGFLIFFYFIINSLRIS